MPQISIIVPTFNSMEVVGAGLLALAGQSFRDFEVLVCDGASKDKTADIVETFRAQLPALRIDSRRDSGVYDAINRGIRMSSGRWICILGSDDRVADAEVLADVARELNGTSVALIYGDVRMMGPNRCGVAPFGRYAGSMTFYRLTKQNICQQAIFYRRDLFDRLGLFKLEYKLHADWEFNLRAMARFPAKWIDRVVAEYATAGLSSQSEDALFRKRMPGLVLHLLLAQPLNRSLAESRCRLHEFAQEFGRAGAYLMAGKFRLAHLLLGLAGRLQRLKREVC